MGYTKAMQFSRQQQKIAGVAKAIAHPARIAIIEFLLKVGSSYCREIVSEIKLAQPTVSQHLKELRLAGVVNCTPKGNSVTYSLNAKTIDLFGLYILYVQHRVTNEQKLTNTMSVPVYAEEQMN